jgi:hypothetical protein
MGRAGGAWGLEPGSAYWGPRLGLHHGGAALSEEQADSTVYSLVLGLIRAK